MNAKNCTDNKTVSRFIFDCGNVKRTLLCIDGVRFNVASRFTGTDTLSDRLLSAANAELKKIAANENLEGSERGELWYNHSGS